jgi:hypothetical protein
VRFRAQGPCDDHDGVVSFYPDSHSPSTTRNPQSADYLDIQGGIVYEGADLQASYSNIAVIEMMVGDVAAMKRQSDNSLNATQILKVAGIDKGRRTKILEKEIITGPHEKVQGGYGKYQGTWYVRCGGPLTQGPIRDRSRVLSEVRRRGDPSAVAGI